ncbi:uncharacterized protein BP5553_09793 [Venustampulla echinocandica]|uniref:Uncharacterized protein n=1 Tax=Venustampulla echinocandica TaxID=2656787 RepID=A0A370TAN7_9HELO|nr:uncharacterized protein BP5553_09793 [Venustampulla echinocandica]RDL31004.1 hypothetical protein BP5553_09793 [Venustampulla echinocandica]
MGKDFLSYSQDKTKYALGTVSRRPRAFVVCADVEPLITALFALVPGRQTTYGVRSPARAQNTSVLQSPDSRVPAVASAGRSRRRRRRTQEPEALLFVFDNIDRGTSPSSSVAGNVGNVNLPVGPPPASQSRPPWMACWKPGRPLPQSLGKSGICLA